MGSPFPGMDPYIESCGLFPDFHHDLITDIKRAIGRAAPPGYVARTGERAYLVLVMDEKKMEHVFVPDVRVTAPEERKQSRRRKGATAVADPAEEAEAVEMRAFIEEEHKEAFVEVYLTAPELRLITCVEVLSPANKR